VPQAKSVLGEYEVLQSRYRPPPEVLGTALNNSALSWFIELNALSLIGIKTEDRRLRYEDTPTPEFSVFAEVDISRNSKMFNYFVNRLVDIAVQKFGKMTFNIVDPRQFSEDFINNYGFATTKQPIVGIRQHDAYFVPRDGFVFGAEAAQRFIEDVEGGRIAGNVRRPPGEDSKDKEDDFDPLVVKVTDKTFNSVVHHDTTTDVLIQFYAPWCGHCKSLRPEYNLVAQMFKDSKSIIIAALDATVNTVPKEFAVKVNNELILYFLLYIVYITVFRHRRGIPPLSLRRQHPAPPADPPRWCSTARGRPTPSPHSCARTQAKAAAEARCRHSVNNS
jgi:thiol-disulfide isomerase/thioredoxin